MSQSVLAVLRFQFGLMKGSKILTFSFGILITCFQFLQRKLTATAIRAKFILSFKIKAI